MYANPTIKHDEENHFTLVFVRSFIRGGCSSESIVDQPVVPEPPVVEAEVQPDYTVTQQEAEADLLSMLNEMTFQSVATRSGTPRRIAERYSLGTPAGTRSEAGDSPEPYLHIFNFENEEGFAILSGDERVPSLLTLTCGGSLRPDREIDNPGLAIFLERLPAYYEAQIALADSIHQAISDSLRLVAEQQPRTRAKYPDKEEGDGSDDSPFWNTTYGRWETIGITDPSLSVDWHQNSPYNTYVNNNKAGCVPVAVGQLMTIHRHPASYNGHSFYWDEINKSSVTGRDQAALLLQQLGLPQNLDVAYGIDESPADPRNILRTLRNFGYTNTYLYNYTTSSIVEELSAGYPCLVGGFTDKKTFLGIPVGFKNGHRWLVHGLLTQSRTVTTYNSGSSSQKTEFQYYVMCNMGWQGNAGDGYYLSGVFDTRSYDSIFRPNPSEFNFRYDIDMILYIRKS